MLSFLSNVRFEQYYNKFVISIGVIMENEMKLEFNALSTNEGFARVAVAAFVAVLNPTIEEISDIKTAVSEAVTNAIIHGYEGQEGKIWIYCKLEGELLHISITDKGKGIMDVKQAMEPCFTTKPELERSGMGFAFMEAFMDDLDIETALDNGTTIHMKKKIGYEPWISEEE